jgi:hypothetical protein
LKLKFSLLTGGKPMVEKYPLDQAEQACERMMGGKALPDDADNQRIVSLQFNARGVRLKCWAKS